MATPAVAPLFDQHSHIIGILLAVAIPTFLTTTKAANSTTAQANLQNGPHGCQRLLDARSQTYSGIASAGNPAVSNISEIDTGVNYVSGTNSSGLNVVSLGTDGSTSLVMSAYAPATHDCWTIIDLKAPATIWGQSLDMGTYYALDANVAATDCEATNILPTTGTVTLPEQGGSPKQLLEYLDEDDELKLDAVKRLSFYTTALLDGSITPDHVMEDWPDWYQLVPAFVATYGSEELQELEVAAELLEAIEEQDDVTLTEADRAYLKALETWLDMYPEMRTE